MTDKSTRIQDAWLAEAKMRRAGAAGDFDKTLYHWLTPAGGNWQCVAPEGAITRTITWAGKEVALVNPQGDITDVIEGQIAMAMRALPMMDKALRVITMLATDPANNNLIHEIGLAVVAYIEQPAPKIVEPE